MSTDPWRDARRAQLATVAAAAVGVLLLGALLVVTDAGLLGAALGIAALTAACVSGALGLVAVAYRYREHGTCGDRAPTLVVAGGRSDRTLVTCELRHGHRTGWHEAAVGPGTPPVRWTKGAGA